MLLWDGEPRKRRPLFADWLQRATTQGQEKRNAFCPEEYINDDISEDMEPVDSDIDEEYAPDADADQVDDDDQEQGGTDEEDKDTVKEDDQDENDVDPQVIDAGDADTVDDLQDRDTDQMSNDREDQDQDQHNDQEGDVNGNEEEEEEEVPVDPEFEANLDLLRRVTSLLLHGRGLEERDMNELVSKTRNRILLFVSSTFTESAGPAFFSILCDKYGYRPFPASIESNEFHNLRSSLDSLSQLSESEIVDKFGSTTLLFDKTIPGRVNGLLLSKWKLDYWFKLDENSVPNVYKLVVSAGPGDWDRFPGLEDAVAKRMRIYLSDDVDKNSTDASQKKPPKNVSVNTVMSLLRRCLIPKRDVDWSVDEAALMRLLRAASWDMDSSIHRKYVQSVTEDEVMHGLTRPDKFIGFQRQFTGIQEQVTAHLQNISTLKNPTDTNPSYAKAKAAGSYIDLIWKDNKPHSLDQDAITELQSLSSRIIPRPIETFTVDWMDGFDPFDNGKWQHTEFRRELVKGLDGGRFVERFELINEVLERVRQMVDDGGAILVKGEYGCGKTSILSELSDRLPSEIPNAVIISRFVGSTAGSGDACSLMISISAHIVRTYFNSRNNAMNYVHRMLQRAQISSLSWFDNVREMFVSKGCFPDSMGFDELEMIFPICLGILDGIDQITDTTDEGISLSWLPRTLPKGVQIIFSSYSSSESTNDTTTDSIYVRRLRSRFTSLHEVTIPSLTPLEIKSILESLMSGCSRRLTTSQFTYLYEMCIQCPSPLYIQMVWHDAKTWSSSTQPVLGDSVQSQFDRIMNELERRHGGLLIARALGYITVSQRGLSLSELEDVLSLDDDVLNVVYQYWTPPIRRIPSALWVRIRDDLEDLLSEIGKDGTIIYK
ncbi:hypothetical protein HDU76_012389, partial [Blyttiomyces sp. JEL0837]